MDPIPRDYRLRIVSRDETLHVGEGMGEHEAEYLASLVALRVHPKPRWNDDPAEYGFAPMAKPRTAIPDPPRPPPEGPARKFAWGWALARIAPALIGTILIIFVVSAVLPPLRHPPQLPRLLPPPAPSVKPPPTPADVAGRAGGPPLRQDFDDPRVYAIAMTRYALKGARTKVESGPRCGKTVGWTRWTCRARGRPRIGPFAGRSLLYRCSVEYEQQPIAAPVQAILCGREHPPLTP